VIKAYDEELKVTVSIGISAFPDNTEHMRDLIEMADQALYLAKETGKNKVCFCPPKKDLFLEKIIIFNVEYHPWPGIILSL
jgi:predicted signal transduction protein with EAL and GGDEF domain